VGESALASNTSGSFNIALGASAGSNLTQGFNNIDIGNPGVAGDTGYIRIGTQGTQSRTYIAGISGTDVDGTPVLVNASGQLGVRLSSRRFKNDIQPMDNASEAILELKPVTFHYKSDATAMPQFGLIAEEVEKVNPALISRDTDGKPYTVRYDAVSSMLLNEFLKEHRKVEAQQATIAQLKSAVAQQHRRFAEQETQIRALASGLQKVSAQLATGKDAQRVVANR
jgi:uncharacterized coiled-coil protein SlyX